MHRISARRTGDHVQLPDGIALSVLCNDGDTVLAFRDSSQAPIDDDVEAVASLVWTPKYLAGINLHPVEGRIDVLDYYDKINAHTFLEDVSGTYQVGVAGRLAVSQG